MLRSGYAAQVNELLLLGCAFGQQPLRAVLQPALDGSTQDCAQALRQQVYAHCFPLAAERKGLVSLYSQSLWLQSSSGACGGGEWWWAERGSSGWRLLAVLNVSVAQVDASGARPEAVESRKPSALVSAHHQRRGWPALAIVRVGQRSWPALCCS